MPGELEGILHEKVGGVPAPVIGTLGAVGIIGILWIRRRYSGQTAASNTGTTDASLVTTDGTGGTDPNAIDPQTGLTLAEEQFPSGPLDAYLAGNPTGASYPVGLTPQGLPGPVTNEQWARLAGDWLMSKGSDPALVANALTKFIHGQPLTTAEQSIISLALNTFGEPPEGIQAVVPTPPTPPPPTPPPGPKPPPPRPGVTTIVPNVTGDRVEEANQDIAAAGLKSSFGTRRPNVPYVVSAQSPRAGARVRRGSTVRLTITPERSPRPRPPDVPPGFDPGGPVQGLTFNPPGFP
jgi:PASTA domain